MKMRRTVRRIMRSVKSARRRNNSPRAKLLKSMPREAVCAEIGVWKGVFSKQILKITKPKMMHLIDPWELQEEFPEQRYGGRVAQTQEDMDKIYEMVKAKYKNKKM